jgi:hypothetical protein
MIAAVVLLEHVALLEGVADRGLVVRARLLQHVVKHIGASRGRSTALAGRVYRELILVAPLCACVAVGLLAFLAPLMLLLGFFGLTSLRRRVVHALALLTVENGSTASYLEEKLVAMSNGSLGRPAESV